MNNRLSKSINIESLELLRRIASFGSITRAAEKNGESQSAVSRRLQEVEVRLGFLVFERTTRRLVLTRAGRVLLDETEAIPHILDKALDAVNVKCFGQQTLVEVGVSRGLSIAHLPGLFARGKSKDAKIKLVHPTGRAVVANVLSAKLDVGIATLFSGFPKELQVIHRFEDEFVLISKEEATVSLRRKDSLRCWAGEQQWILPPGESNTRMILDSWLSSRGVQVEPEMELDSFDVMIQLVELGLGVAFVPRRALSGFRRRRGIVRLELGSCPKREIGVFTRRVPKPNAVVEQFVKEILFS